MNAIFFIIFYILFTNPNAPLILDDITRCYGHNQEEKYDDLNHILSFYNVRNLKDLFKELIDADPSNSGVWQLCLALQINNISDKEKQILAIKKIRQFILEHEEISRKTTILTIALGISFYRY